MEQIGNIYHLLVHNGTIKVTLLLRESNVNYVSNIYMEITYLRKRGYLLTKVNIVTTFICNKAAQTVEHLTPTKKTETLPRATESHSDK